MASNNILYMQDIKTLFVRATTGFFEPVAYNCKEVNGEHEGMEILKGDFIYDFLIFIRYSERKEKMSGKKLFKIEDGFLDVFQWSFALKALGLAERMDAEKLIGVFSRQS